VCICLWCRGVLSDILTFLIYIIVPLNLCRVCWLYYQSSAEMLHPNYKYVTRTSLHHLSLFLPYFSLISSSLPPFSPSPLSLSICIHKTWRMHVHHTHTYTHLYLPALKPESVPVKSLSYFSGWWNILPRPENIINRGPHCLLSALACIRNVIILDPATSSCAFIVGSDHNFLPAAFKEDWNDKKKKKTKCWERKMCKK